MVVWSIGEILWDVFPSHEQLGGAPLNFSANMQRLGDRALLLSAVGNDARGQLALERMKELGLDTAGVQQADHLSTGTAVVTTAANGEPSFVIPRPAAFDELSVDPKLLAAAKTKGVDWLYFGTLVQTAPAAESFVSSLLAELHPTRCFYDINLRDGHWNLSLVQRLSHLASIIKLNEGEAHTLFELTQPKEALFSLEAFSHAWSAAYDLDVICITLGPDGCLVYDKGELTSRPGYSVTVCDTVGSGDAFAAAFLHGYSRGWATADAARFANALGALVASRAGATPDWTIAAVSALMNAPKS